MQPADAPGWPGEARIDDVLADLGGQLEAAEAAELAAEIEDRTRRETALISVVDRLRASVGSPLSVRTAAGILVGDLLDAGTDWLLLGGGPGRSALVPLRAAVAVAGLAPSAVAAASVGPVAGRIDLRHVLRGLVRDREPVRLVVADGTTYPGVLNRCGADFIEVTGPAAGRDTGGQSWLVPLAAVVVLHLR